MSVVEEQSLEREFPEKCLCELELTLKDGCNLSSGTTGATGDPDNPLGIDGMEQKFKQLAATVLSAARVEEILELVWHLDKLDNLELLIEFLSSTEKGKGGI